MCTELPLKLMKCLLSVLQNAEKCFQYYAMCLAVCHFCLVHHFHSDAASTNVNETFVKQMDIFV